MKIHFKSVDITRNGPREEVDPEHKLPRSSGKVTFINALHTHGLMDNYSKLVRISRRSPTDTTEGELTYLWVNTRRPEGDWIKREDGCWKWERQ